MASTNEKSSEKLWLLIGAHRIEWCVVAGRGETTAFQALGSVAIDTGAERVWESALGEAFRSMPADWTEDRIPKHGVSVLVADRWLSLAVLPWSSALEKTDSAHVHARLQFIDAGFTVAATDEIRLDDAPFGSPRLAVAYPAEILSLLRQHVQQSDLSLLSVLPFSAAIWMSAGEFEKTRPQALVLINDDDIVIAARWGPRRFFDSHIADMHLRQRNANLSAIADLAEVWERLCLRQPQWANLQMLRVFDGSSQEARTQDLPQPFAQAEWRNDQGESGFLASWLTAQSCISESSALDAVSSPLRMGLKHRLALGAASLIVGLLTILAVQASSASARLHAEIVALSQPVVQVSNPVWTREEIGRVQAVNSAIRELNLPVNALLRSLEPPRDIRVAILSVETGGEASLPDARSSLKIVAQAPTSAEMARYVGFVAERKPFTGAYLTRHESVDIAGERFFRFTVEAQWND